MKEIKVTEVRGTRLSDLVKEFLGTQKRRVAVQLRIIARTKAVLEKKDEKAKELLLTLNEMIKKKISFEKIIALIKPKMETSGEWNKDSEWLHSKHKELEDDLASRLKEIIEENPVWQEWLSKVKGIGFLLAAEMIGSFESALEDGETLGRHFKTVSQMWAFAGLDVKNGKAPKKILGKKTTFNSTLKSILIGRIGNSLIMQTSGEKGAYRSYYDEQKKKLQCRFEKVSPSNELPLDSRGRKYEPPGIISKGHLHNMVRRKMVKLFVSHLWEIVRKTEGLPTGKPYAIEILGHSHSHYIAPFRDKE